MEGGAVLGHGDVNKPSEGDNNPFTHEDAGWVYCRLLTYISVIFMKTIIVKKEMDNVCNRILFISSGHINPRYVSPPISNLF
jgi:hypothetical protein